MPGALDDGCVVALVRLARRRSVLAEARKGAVEVLHNLVVVCINVVHFFQVLDPRDLARRLIPVVAIVVRGTVRDARNSSCHETTHCRWDRRASAVKNRRLRRSTHTPLDPCSDAFVSTVGQLIVVNGIEQSLDAQLLGDALHLVQPTVAQVHLSPIHEFQDELDVLNTDSTNWGAGMRRSPHANSMSTL